MPKDFNLDEGVEEFFTFTILGNTYSFKYPNSEELEELSKIAKTDIEKLSKSLLSFITPIADSKPFEEIQKKMLTPHIAKFNKMIIEEIVGVKE